MVSPLLQVAKIAETAEVVVRLRARELTKFVALRMLEYLVKVTPVDTSKALSNWRISTSGSSYGAEPIPAHVFGSHGSTAGASAAKAILEAKHALKGAQPQKALAIINAVPYLKRLNDGYSAQHPGGFVEGAILVGKQATKEYNFNQRLAQDIRRGRVTPDG